MIYLFIFINYIIGSIPFGLLLTKIKSGIDIRTIGSGNIGATNVLRTGNKTLAILTLLLDGCKGGIGLFLYRFMNCSNNFDQDLVIMASALLGHLFPVFLRFKGGKGIATLLGSLFILMPNIAFISCIIWLCVVFITRFSSLAALITVSLLPLYGFYFAGFSFLIWSLILGSLIIYKHKENIIRLYHQKEPRLNVFF